MEDYRLQYPLSNKSVVVDVGGFRGDFVDWCLKKWGCTVHVFEPVRLFYENIRAAYGRDARVTAYNYGLGAEDKAVAITVRGDSSSVYLPGEEQEGVLIRDVVQAFVTLGIRAIDLMKVNIEGGEYDLIPRLIGTGLIGEVQYLQVQFHSYGASDPTAARDAIRTALSRTHREEWCVGNGQWESWARRG